MKAHGNHVWTLARKELRGFFHSPVAMIFLAVFLVAVLFSFFFIDGFLARDVADLKPLFHRLPLLLVFLVAALTMRMWSEEQKVGTLEVLLTLPIPGWKLVAGKFLAGLLLVALALALTLGVPITVAFVGDLDWGPVFGGYLAALLLGSAYLAIGLCVSSLTDNQIVSLALTSVAGLLLYLIGTDASTAGTGYETAEVLRAVGTGSRFDNVARGVLDLRDLVYWVSLIGLFLAVNVFILETKSWSGDRLAAAETSEAHRRRRRAKITIALIAANAVALNLWLAPVRSLRVDLTEEGLYGLSPVTEDLLQSLDEPLVIRAFLSDKTHPLVAPLIPEVRDQLEEYEAIGGGRVRIEIVDPTSEELESELQEQYGIEPLEFSFNDRRSAQMVRAYFHILLEYGDQHTVLGFQDLVDVRQVGPTELDLRLNNFEFTATSAIKKLVLGFYSLEYVFANLGATPRLTFLVPETLPDSLAAAPATVEKIARKIAADAGGTIEFTRVAPTTEKEMAELVQRYGLRPQLTIVGDRPEAFFYNLILEVGDRALAIPAPLELDESAIETSLTEAFERASPGFTRTVGLVTPPAQPAAPPQMPGMPPPQPRPAQSFETLEESLRDHYAVRPVTLEGGKVDDSVDVLLLAGPEKLEGKALEAIDQFLMRGGAVVALVGRYRIDLDSSASFGLEPVDPGLGELLESYGIGVEAKLAADTEASSFVVPILQPGRRPAPFLAQNYPFALRVTGDRLANHVATNPLHSAVFHYASPLQLMTPQAQVGEEDTAETTALAHSSSEAWVQINTAITPDPALFGEGGFGVPDAIPEADRGPHVLVAVATGPFGSHFAAASEKAAENEGEEEKAGDKSPLLERSSPDARLAVVGSSSFVDDLTLNLARNGKSLDAENNIQLVMNLIDWGLADTEMLSIRARGAKTRTLDLDDDERTRWELINYAIALIALGLVVGASLWRRRRQPSFELDPSARRRWSGGASGGSVEDSADEPAAGPERPEREDELEDEAEDEAEDEPEDEPEDDSSAEEEE